jgi:hypothetical protein
MPGCGFVIAMAGRQHHAFTDAELHLARRQVGDHHRVLADQVGGLVALAMPLKTLRVRPSPRPASGAAACGTVHRFAIDDFGDAQVDLREVVDGDEGRWLRRRAGLSCLCFSCF